MGSGSAGMCCGSAGMCSGSAGMGRWTALLTRKDSSWVSTCLARASSSAPVTENDPMYCNTQIKAGLINWWTNQSPSASLWNHPSLHNNQSLSQLSVFKWQAANHYVASITHDSVQTAGRQSVLLRTNWSVTHPVNHLCSNQAMDSLKWSTNQLTFLHLFHKNINHLTQQSSNCCCCFYTQSTRMVISVWHTSSSHSRSINQQLTNQVIKWGQEENN